MTEELDPNANATPSPSPIPAADVTPSPTPSPTPEPPAAPLSMHERMVQALEQLPEAPAAPAAPAPSPAPATPAAAPAPGAAAAPAGAASPAIDPKTGKPVVEEPASLKPGVPLDEKALLEGVGSGPAQERIKALIGRNQQTEQLLTQRTQELQKASAITNELNDWMNTHGVSNEQFESHIVMLEDFQRLQQGDMEAGNRVMQALATAAQQVALITGREVSLSDPLANFPALAEQVKTGELTRAAALELAAARGQQQRQQQTRQRQEQSREQQRAFERAADKAASDLQAFAASCVQTDPHAQVKLKALSEEISKGTFGEDPVQMPRLAMAFYRRLPNPVAAPVPVPTPLPRAPRQAAAPAPNGVVPTVANREQRMADNIAAALNGTT